MEIKSYNPPFYLSFLSGVVAHAYEVSSLGHILDRIRVEQEVHPQLTLRKAVLSIWKKGRWNAFYRGLRWNIGLSAMKGGFGWSLHNVSNRFMLGVCHQKDPLHPSFPFVIAVGLGSAFLETTLILCPLERLKTVEMTHNSKQIFTVNEYIKKEGIQFFYRGWKLVMLRQSCSWISYLGIYQHLRHSFLAYNEDRSLSLIQKVFLGGITGGVVAVINAPLDLLKTRAQKANPLHSKGVFFAVRSVLDKHGWRGLYSGLSMKVGRHIWSSASILIILDQLQALPSNMKI